MNNFPDADFDLKPEFFKKLAGWKSDLAANVFLLNSIEKQKAELIAEDLCFGFILLHDAGKIFPQLKIIPDDELQNQLLVKLHELNGIFHVNLLSQLRDVSFKTDAELLIKIFNELFSELEEKSFAPEQFGVIYEYLKFTPVSSNQSKNHKRKTRGVFYTPVYIVDYIIEKSLSAKKDLTGIKIYDPACGSGIFLLRAFDHLQKKIFLNKKTDFLEAQEIILNNIYGTDLDSAAVEVTKYSLLRKIINGKPEQYLPDISRNFDCINFLFDETSLFDHFSGRFDVIIGNPPYNALLNERERKALKKKYSIGTTDTAALFMLVADEKLKPGGVNGFIIPKPFVFSSNWKKLRERFLEGITELIDCGKVWKEVKLEQVIYFYIKDKSFNFYLSGIRKEKNILSAGKIEKNFYNEFGLLLNGISDAGLNVGLKLRNAGLFLNDVTINHRGAPLQKSILNEKSDFKVIGGKQIKNFVIDESFKGYFPLDELNDSHSIVKEGSILVQNIVAHVQKPEPQIKIIAALADSFERKNYLILDTINQLQNKSRYSSEFICALLNSKLIAWYVYNFIFGRAVRTMHFDNYVTKRIPVPLVDFNDEQVKKNYKLINNLVQKLIAVKQERKSRKNGGHPVQQIQNEIESLIRFFYGLSPEEEKIIYTKGVT